MKNPKGTDRNYANELQDIKPNEANESEEVVRGRGGTRCCQSLSSLSGYLLHVAALTFSSHLLIAYSHSASSFSSLSLSEQYIFMVISGLCSEINLFHYAINPPSFTRRSSLCQSVLPFQCDTVCRGMK